MMHISLDSSVTIENVKKMRRDLEKRLLIDIAQFEKDTGMIVLGVDLTHVTSMGGASQLVNAAVSLDLSR